MKYLRLVLCLTVVAFFSHATVTLADSYDSETATIQKKSDHSAKVIIGKETYSAPVSFADGASWDNVKDHYEVADSVVSGLKAHKIMISVGADGTASFAKCHCSKSKK